jgi:hypothetical protein
MALRCRFGLQLFGLEIILGYLEFQDRLTAEAFTFDIHHEHPRSGLPAEHPRVVELDYRPRFLQKRDERTELCWHADA